MNIGQNLRRIRESRAMTQAQLAESVRIAAPTVCQLERGTRTLTLPLAKEMADVLKCSVNDFLETE